MMPGKVAVKPVPFREAIDHFRSKARVPTAHYTDLMDAAHARGFMVAGAMQEELLAGFQQSLLAALKNGTTLADFRRDFDKLVLAHGWSYHGERGWRTALIFGTNVRQAYMAGKWEQAQATKDTRPYGRYVATLDRRTRTQHKAWHGMVVPLDDPWWETHMPLNGYGCRCSMQTVSDYDMRREGWEAVSPPREEMRKVMMHSPHGPIEVETVPGVDPGFAYNVGLASKGVRLTPSQLAAARASDAWQEYRPLSAATWQSMGRQAAVPADAPRAALGPTAATRQEMETIIRRMIGGEQRFVDTPDGGKVLLAVGALQHLAMRRAPFVPLIDETLTEPYEIWLAAEQHKVTGRIDLRKRFIKRVKIGENEREFYLVANVVNGLFLGWTFVPASSASVLNNQRRGRLLWGRP